MKQVDAFVVVHAGQGAERTGDAIDLWSVKWTLPKAREADGVAFKSHLDILTNCSQVSRYTASCLWQKTLPVVFVRTSWVIWVSCVVDHILNYIDLLSVRLA